MFFLTVKNRINYRKKCILTVQKTLRGYLARKQHQPRYKGIVKINKVRRNMKQMEEIANQLKGEREVMLKQIEDVEAQIDLAIKKIKVRIEKHSID